MLELNCMTEPEMVKEVEFDVARRLEGESKWSVTSLIRYAISNLMGYSDLPMHLVTWTGILFLIFALIMSIQTLCNFLSGGAVEGFTTVILLVLFTGSIIMISLGIIGSYISRIYTEIKNRPRYIISRQL